MLTWENISQLGRRSVPEQGRICRGQLPGWGRLRRARANKKRVKCSADHKLLTASSTAHYVSVYGSPLLVQIRQVLLSIYIHSLGWNKLAMQIYKWIRHTEVTCRETFYIKENTFSMNNMDNCDTRLWPYKPLYYRHVCYYEPGCLEMTIERNKHM